jgi:hypothetical protein
MRDRGTPYKYWAFVSYSHHDKRVARRLVAELAKRSVPRRFRSRVVGQPGRLAAIFRDERDIGAAPSLAPALIEALDRSAKLIVICSPFSAASDYVASEIAHFVANGRARDILCLVASGIPNATDDGRPQFECFPWPLRERRAEDGSRRPIPLSERPLAAVLGHESKQEWSSAVTQLTAGLLDLSQTDLRRAQARTVLWRGLAAACAAVVLLAGGYAVWSEYFATHVAYYRDFQRRNGIWQGLDEVPRETAARLDQAYVFTTRGHSTGPQSVRLVAHGAACPREGMTSVLGNSLKGDCTVARACEARFQYTSDGEIRSEAMLDQFGRELERISYDKPIVGDFKEGNFGCTRTGSGIKYVVFERHTDKVSPLLGLDKKVKFLGEDPKREPRPNPDGAFGIKFDYAPDGRVARKTFVDARGAVTAGKKGYAGWKAVRDEGRLVRKEYFGQDGALAVNSDGYAAATFTYDADGNAAETRYYDPQAAAVLRKAGQAGTRWTRNHDRKSEVAENLDRDGKVAPQDEGIAATRIEYDGRGNEKRRLFFAADGKRPVYGVSGYGAEITVYDDQGNQAGWIALDLDGTTPISSADGYARWEQKIDGHGNIVSLRMYDRAGALALSKSMGKVAGKDVTWGDKEDDKDRMVEEAYVGKDGELAPGEDGYAMVKMSYDSRGNKTEGRFYDSLRRPTVRRDGCGAWRSAFDDLGRKSEQRWFGKDGEGDCDSSGYSIMQHDYDAVGRIVEERYMNARRELSALVDGVAVVRHAYNGRGDRIMSEYFDERRNPVLVGTNGYSKIKWEYDPSGRKIGERYFAGDARAESSSGIHWISYQYDQRGRLARTDFKDANERPKVVARWGELTDVTGIRYVNDVYGHVIQEVGLCESAAACDGKAAIDVIRRSYERRGWETERRFFRGKQPAADSRGVYGESRTYNDVGSVTRLCMLGQDGQPVATRASAVACQENIYNERDLMVERRSVDSKGQPVWSGTDCPVERWSYDDWGRTVSYSCHEADGSAAIDRSTGYHSSVRSNDRWGHLVDHTFFGLDGKQRAIRHLGGDRISRIAREYDVYGRVLRERYFDISDKPVDDDLGVHEIRRSYTKIGNSFELFDAKGRKQEPSDSTRYKL